MFGYSVSAKRTRKNAPMLRSFRIPSEDPGGLVQESTYDRRILVLDDDEVMRELLEALLTLKGHQVTLAGSGSEALAILAAENNFDLVLTDLHMPQIEGEELAARLRAAVSPGTLVIGMSGRHVLDGERRILDAFLPKPFDMAALENAIQSAHARRVNNASKSDSSLNSSNVETGSQPALNETIFNALGKTLPLKQLLELYDLTLADVAKRHTRIEAAAAAGDLDTVQREAHAIKGSCGMVGASELQALAAATEGGTTLNTSAISQIPAACLRLRRMLDAKLQTA
jgi:CheY-like chemotaxis protein